MTDGVKKGAGNSRYLKSVSNFLSLYPTYEKFAQALIAGTLPIDLNGINAAGWSTQGTTLNKANLLADATATGMGLTAAATPNQAFAQLRALIATAQNTANGRANIAAGSYVGTGTFGETNPNSLTFGFKPQLVIISYTTEALGCYAFPAFSLGSTYRTKSYYYWGAHNLSNTALNATRTAKISGNTLIWYSDNADFQLNYRNTRYNYLAIG